MGTVRRKVAAGAVGAALLGVGLGFGAHAATSGPTVTRPASDQAAVSTDPAPTTAAATTSEAAPTTAAAPTTVTVVEQPSADTQAATVGQVTTDTAPTADSTSPAADTTTATTEVAPQTVGGQAPPPMPKLPGEDGYVPPDQTTPAPPPPAP